MGIAAYFGVDLAAGRTQGNRDLGSAQVDPGVELVRFCHQSGLATSQYITDQDLLRFLAIDLADPYHRAGHTRNRQRTANEVAKRNGIGPTRGSDDVFRPEKVA
jgi:hypothetical protein